MPMILLCWYLVQQSLASVLNLPSLLRAYLLGQIIIKWHLILPKRSLFLLLHHRNLDFCLILLLMLKLIANKSSKLNMLRFLVLFLTVISFGTNTLIVCAQLLAVGWHYFAGLSLFSLTIAFCAITIHVCITILFTVRLLGGIVPINFYFALFGFKNERRV